MGAGDCQPVHNFMSDWNNCDKDTQKAFINQIAYEVFTRKMDTKTNPLMVYKTLAATNKGLNPECYVGNNAKLVNILNNLEREIGVIDNSVGGVYKIFNPVVGDTTNSNVQLCRNALKEVTGKESIIEILYWLFVNLNLITPINNP